MLSSVDEGLSADSAAEATEGWTSVEAWAKGWTTVVGSTAAVVAAVAAVERGRAAVDDAVLRAALLSMEATTDATA